MVVRTGSRLGIGAVFFARGRLLCLDWRLFQVRCVRPAARERIGQKLCKPAAAWIAAIAAGDTWAAHRGCLSRGGRWKWLNKHGRSSKGSLPLTKGAKPVPTQPAR